MANQKKSRNSKEFPTPVNILWENVLMIPIFGVVDSKKAQEIMETMLNKILETEARIIILDILGVVTMDTAVANHLIKITKANKLMGADCIISGISPSIAKTLVHLGVELRDVTTTSTLKDAVAFAFDKLNLEIRTKEVMKKKNV